MRGEKPTTNNFQSRGRSEGADAIDQASQGANPAPTKGPLQTRSASPSNYATSGIEAAMGAQADKLHPPRKR